MKQTLTFLAALLLSPLATLHAAEDERVLWTPAAALPKTVEAPVLDGVRFSVIKPYEIQKDGYRFLQSCTRLLTCGTKPKAPGTPKAR